MTRDTWEQLGRPRLHESGIYLKLVDQGLIEPIGVWKNVDTAIKGILTKVDFEIIDLGRIQFLPSVSRSTLGEKNESLDILGQRKNKIKGEWTKSNNTYPSIPRRTLDRIN